MGDHFPELCEERMELREQSIAQEKDLFKDFYFLDTRGGDRKLGELMQLDGSSSLENYKVPC